MLLLMLVLYSHGLSLSIFDVQMEIILNRLVDKLRRKRRNLHKQNACHVSLMLHIETLLVKRLEKSADNFRNR